MQKLNKILKEKPRFRKSRVSRCVDSFITDLQPRWRCFKRQKAPLLTAKYKKCKVNFAKKYKDMDWPQVIYNEGLLLKLYHVPNSKYDVLWLARTLDSSWTTNGSSDRQFLYEKQLLECHLWKSWDKFLWSLCKISSVWWPTGDRLNTIIRNRHRSILTFMRYLAAMYIVITLLCNF